MIFLLLLELWTNGSTTTYANVEVSLSQPNEDQRQGDLLPEIIFLNEDDKKVSLKDTAQSRPLLLVPFYAHCKSTCPLNVAHLKDVLKDDTHGGDYGVILFSFNPNDTAGDLKDFRRALQIPSTWSILRATPNDTHLLTEALDFRYMSQGNTDFIHSNIIIVLSPGLRIIKFIRGLGYTINTVDEAIREARQFGNQIYRYFPLISFAGLVLILFSISFWARGEARVRLQKLVSER